MLFRKLSDEQFFRLKLETYTQVEVIASALLYMEYRIKYNSKKTSLQARRCRQCLVYLHEEVNKNEKFFDPHLEDMNEMCFVVAQACKENGWHSMECMLDGLELRAGYSGSMPYQLKAALIGTVKTFLEEAWELPVTKIIRRGDDLESKSDNAV